MCSNWWLFAAQVCARWQAGLPSVDEEPELAVKYAKLLATLANEVRCCTLNSVLA